MKNSSLDRKKTDPSLNQAYIQFNPNIGSRRSNIRNLNLLNKQMSQKIQKDWTKSDQTLCKISQRLSTRGKVTVPIWFSFEKRFFWKSKFDPRHALPKQSHHLSKKWAQEDVTFMSLALEIKIWLTARDKSKSNRWL